MPDLLICARTADSRIAAEGSIERPCSRCGELALVARVSQEILVRPGAVVVCTRCIDPMESTEMVDATPLEAYIEAVKALSARVRRHGRN